MVRSDAIVALIFSGSDSRLAEARIQHEHRHLNPPDARTDRFFFPENPKNKSGDPASGLLGPDLHNAD